MSNNHDARNAIMRVVNGDMVVNRNGDVNMVVDRNIYPLQVTNVNNPGFYVGAIGNMGPQGAMGYLGPRGDQGVTGAIGPRGVQGTTGAQGPRGVQGATGAQGPTGSVGDSMYSENMTPYRRHMLTRSTVQWTGIPYHKLHCNSIVPKISTSETSLLHYRGSKLTLEKNRIYKLHTGLTILMNPNQSLSEFLTTFNIMAHESMAMKGIMIHNILSCEKDGQIYCMAHLVFDTPVTIKSGDPIASIACSFGGHPAHVPEWSNIAKTRRHLEIGKLIKSDVSRNHTFNKWLQVLAGKFFEGTQKTSSKFPLLARIDIV